MYNIILVLCAVLAVAKGHAEEIAPLGSQHHIVPQIRADDYINLNELQHAKVLQDYDTALEHFAERFLGSLDGLKLESEMVSSSIVQVEEHLNPLEVLSDLSKHCVSKYRIKIPTVIQTKTGITRCGAAASSQLNVLLQSARSTRDILANYYKNHYAKHMNECATSSSSPQNYTSCIMSVAGNTNAFTINNQKTFETQMDAAECTAKAYIKRALDCSYTVQNRAISLIAEANLLINRCLEGKDECKPCDPAHSCPNVMQLSEGDAKRELLANPFHGLNNDHEKCVILSISKH